MTDPRVLSIISCIFAMMAAYTLYSGLRQLRDARRAGRPQRWYKHLGLLTGIEYGLLAFVFLLRMASAQGAIAPNMRGLLGWLYIILLLPAALVAGLVIRRVILNMRANGQARQAAVGASPVSLPRPAGQETPALTKQQREEQLQRQRERRKKAAAARRRQAGRA